MANLTDLTVTVIGAGNMGGAVARAIRKAGVSERRLVLFNSSEESTSRAAREIGAASAFELFGSDATLATAVAESHVIVLGFKPYHLEAMAPKIAPHVQEGTLIVSLLAGASLDTLSDAFDGHKALVRAMPNTPIAVGQGVVGLMPGEHASESERELARALFEKSATVVEIPEHQVHGVIGAAGSASAYFFLIAEAMIDEAVAEGFTRAVATDLVVGTMLGSATLLHETGEAPTSARYAVTSPGGATAQAIAALEEGGIRALMARGMRAAADTSRKMEER
ncbi:pyrroline-5-carboxylate reductase [Dermabacter sp. p3-SID358]|uniref:pyrroline-5-carboxylate reductase n=1 Tax=Dermabacter sp. p3-SID358 TaxID=2916114 RepID=UPI0021A61A6F|nr:pyrroline-5-carboxylate reductase [Dermabacter sp. p3-SID358]MCT1867253.1 pyrroline-5-carboxylate reductase [Dermabacter sp. p3-SID358]